MWTVKLAKLASTIYLIKLKSINTQGPVIKEMAHCNNTLVNPDIPENVLQLAP